MVREHMLEDYERVHLLDIMYLHEDREEGFFTEVTKTTVELGAYGEKSRNHSKLWPFRKNNPVSVIRGKNTKAGHESFVYP